MPFVVFLDAYGPTGFDVIDAQVAGTPAVELNNGGADDRGVRMAGDFFLGMCDRLHAQDESTADSWGRRLPHMTRLRIVLSGSCAGAFQEDRSRARRRIAIHLAEATDIPVRRLSLEEARRAGQPSFRCVSPTGGAP